MGDDHATHQHKLYEDVRRDHPDHSDFPPANVNTLKDIVNKTGKFIKRVVSAKAFDDLPVTTQITLLYGFVYKILESMGKAPRGGLTIETLLLTEIVGRHLVRSYNQGPITGTTNQDYTPSNRIYTRNPENETINIREIDRASQSEEDNINLLHRLLNIVNIWDDYNPTDPSLIVWQDYNRSMDAFLGVFDRFSAIIGNDRLSREDVPLYNLLRGEINGTNVNLTPGRIREAKEKLYKKTRM
ncbi:hypothetical protein GEMRC1_012665 [Eukaryota sp. GEM-RC1]